MSHPPPSELREQPAPYGSPSSPADDARDPVTEAFKRDVDRTLLRENLKLSPQQRSEKFLRFMAMVYELREAGERERRPGR